MRCRRLCWRLRLLQPLHHGVVEIRLTNRLGQILAVGAGLHATARQGIARGAEDDDRHLRQGCIALHPRQQAEAILFRHHHVGQQHVEGGVDHLSLLEQGHRLADVLRQGYLAVPGGQLMRQDLQIGGVVIDHQHLELIKLARTRRQAVTLLQRQGQGEEELAAVVAIAAQLDVSLHHLYQALGDGQPQAGAAEAPRGGAVGLAEGLKQLALLFGGDADAGILYREAAGCLLLILSQQLDADHHLTAFGELDGVAHQVGQHLAEPLAVAEQMDGMERRRAEDLQPLAVGHRGETLDQILQQQIQIEGAAFQLQLARLDLREVEDIVDDGQQVFPRAPHDAHEAPLLLIQCRGAEEICHADDAVEGGADLMAHHRQEFALGPVGGLGCIPRLDQVEGPQIDDLLEMVAVFLQIAIPLVDLRQHVVKAFG